MDSDTFKVLWKKQRLAEVRDAIVRGDWPEPLPNDSDSSDGDSDSVSTSSTNSPGHHKHHHQQDSDDDSEFEEALQEAADAQLHVVLASLKEQQKRELQASRAAAAEIEEQHTATTKQMADIQAQLDELKREKHELFQQLKLVSLISWWLVRVLRCSSLHNQLLTGSWGTAQSRCELICAGVPDASLVAWSLSGSRALLVQRHYHTILVRPAL